jgi:hypothetical protein
VRRAAAEARPLYAKLLPAVVERLGDGHQDVRQAACNLMLGALQVGLWACGLWAGPRARARARVVSRARLSPCPPPSVSAQRSAGRGAKARKR